MDNEVTSRTGKVLRVPTVHLNGSSRDDLVGQCREVYRAITQAMEALNQAAPHARDYYVQDDPEAFEKARRQHEARAQKLIEVMDEYAILAYEIQDQG